MATIRHLVFTGAPDSTTLDWSAPDLLEVLEPKIKTFLDNRLTTNFKDASALLPTASNHASWRSLPMDRRHLTTGHSQLRENMQFQVYGSDESTSFLSVSDYSSNDSHNADEQQNSLPPLATSEISSNSENDAISSQYYEHSFALHAGIPSSQIPPASKSDCTELSASYLSTPSSLESTAPPPAPAPPMSGHLSDLEDLPNASYLVKIQPQTMTVNLIVGVISVSQPRAIHTKRGNTVHLVEFLVGDNTRTGFVVNFWLGNDVGDETGQYLTSLRSQDILLLRNVALSSFKGKVYGQSLRKGMTRCDLLFRVKFDRKDVGGCYGEKELGLGQYETTDAVGGRRHPQLEKTRKVRLWVLRFVGPAPRMARTGPPDGGHRSVKRKTEFKVQEVLPPDTQ